jgi:hypothetical protein
MNTGTMNTGMRWLLAGLVPLALTSCPASESDSSSSYYSVKIVNQCGESKSVYIDDTFQSTISSGRSLRITSVEEGTHTLRATGLDPLRVYFDRDKVWTLCP